MEVPKVGWGDFKVITARDPAILIIRYDWRNNSALFVHNAHWRRFAAALAEALARLAESWMI
jgi:maltose alpha-D-glucosyltransferase/alpha-amylase